MDEIRHHYKRNVMVELCMLIHPDKKESMQRLWIIRSLQ